MGILKSITNNILQKLNKQVAPIYDETVAYPAGALMNKDGQIEYTPTATTAGITTSFHDTDNFKYLDSFIEAVSKYVGDKPRWGWDSVNNIPTCEFVSPSHYGRVGYFIIDNSSSSSNGYTYPVIGWSGTYTTSANSFWNGKIMFIPKGKVLRINNANSTDVYIEVKAFALNSSEIADDFVEEGYDCLQAQDDFLFTTTLTEYMGSKHRYWTDRFNSSAKTVSFTQTHDDTYYNAVMIHVSATNVIEATEENIKKLFDNITYSIEPDDRAICFNGEFEYSTPTSTSTTTLSAIANSKMIIMRDIYQGVHSKFKVRVTNNNNLLIKTRIITVGNTNSYMDGEPITLGSNACNVIFDWLSTESGKYHHYVFGNKLLQHLLDSTEELEIEDVNCTFINDTDWSAAGTQVMEGTEGGYANFVLVARIDDDDISIGDVESYVTVEPYIPDTYDNKKLTLGSTNGTSLSIVSDPGDTRYGAMVSPHTAIKVPSGSVFKLTRDDTGTSTDKYYVYRYSGTDFPSEYWEADGTVGMKLKNLPETGTTEILSSNVILASSTYTSSKPAGCLSQDDNTYFMVGSDTTSYQTAQDMVEYTIETFKGFANYYPYTQSSTVYMNYDSTGKYGVLPKIYKINTNQMAVISASVSGPTYKYAVFKMNKGVIVPGSVETSDGGIGFLDPYLNYNSSSTSGSLPKNTSFTISSPANFTNTYAEDTYDTYIVPYVYFSTAPTDEVMLNALNSITVTIGSVTDVYGPYGTYSDAALLDRDVTTSGTRHGTVIKLPSGTTIEPTAYGSSVTNETDENAYVTVYPTFYIFKGTLDTTNFPLYSGNEYRLVETEWGESGTISAGTFTKVTTVTINQSYTSDADDIYAMFTGAPSSSSTAMSVDHLKVMCNADISKFALIHTEPASDYLGVQLYYSTSGTYSINARSGTIYENLCYRIRNTPNGYTLTTDGDNKFVVTYTGSSSTIKAQCFSILIGTSSSTGTYLSKTAYYDKTAHRFYGNLADIGSTYVPVIKQSSNRAAPVMMECNSTYTTVELEPNDSYASSSYIYALYIAYCDTSGTQHTLAEYESMFTVTAEEIVPPDVVHAKFIHEEDYQWIDMIADSSYFIDNTQRAYDGVCSGYTLTITPSDSYVTGDSCIIGYATDSSVNDPPTNIKIIGYIPYIKKDSTNISYFFECTGFETGYEAGVLECSGTAVSKTFEQDVNSISNACYTSTDSSRTLEQLKAAFTITVA